MILVVLAVDVAYVALVFATGDDPEPEEPDVETAYAGRWITVGNNQS